MTIPLWPSSLVYGRGPIAQVQPFSYQDDVTFLDILYKLRDYVDGPIREKIDVLIAEVNQAIAESQALTAEKIAEMVLYVNNAVAEIINNSITLQDDVLAGILADPDSDATGIIEDLYLPAIEDRTYHVSPRGSDSNSGLTTKDALLTVGGALTKLAGQRGDIVIEVGTVDIGDVSAGFVSGTTISGKGMDLSIINVPSGVGFGVATPGVRSFSYLIRDLTIKGPGKTVLNAIGVDWDSVSTSVLSNVKIVDFQYGVRIRSLINGGSLYNRLIDVDVRTCGTGIEIGAIGSNGNVIAFSRFNQCDVGFRNIDANNNHLLASQVEKCGLGVEISATTNAKSDNVVIDQCRFEENTVAWSVTSAFVRGARILNPLIFQAYVYNDAGTRTTITGSDITAKQIASTTYAGIPNWLYQRTSAVTDETPAFVVEDANTGSGTPVALEARTGRSTGWAMRARRVPTNEILFDVDGVGNVRSPQPGFHEWGASRTTDPAAPAAGQARLYFKTLGTGKVGLFVRMPTGAAIQLAIEP